MATIVDVAKRAGVSQGTVSCVLNKRASALAISPQTKARVLTAAADLGYRRDEIARAMISGRLSTVGVAVIGINHEIIGDIMEGILDVADEVNYSVKIIRIGKRSGTDIAHVCRQYRLAGLICSQLRDGVVEDIAKGVEPTRVPLVVVDNSTPAPWKYRVLSDDPGGLRQAIRHLKELGHRRLGFCAAFTQSPWSVRRRQGFVDALAALRLPVDSHWCYRNMTMANDGTLGGDYAALRRDLKSGKDRPTALLCDGDPLAMGLIRALHHDGFVVPRDVSIVGFADMNVGFWCDPPLTTVRQPFRKMGAAAMRRLMALILKPGEAGDPSRMTELLPTALVVRGSTAPPRQVDVGP